MRKFIYKILIYAGMVFILLMFFDYIISEGLKKSGKRIYQSWTAIYNSKANADVLILGSSRAWGQYDPQIIDSVLHVNSYNLGIDGHVVDFQILKYETYRRFNKTPKYIIHNIDFSMLLMTKSGYEKEQFFPYIHDGVLINKVENIKKISYIDRYFPFVRYWGYKKLIFEGIFSFIGFGKVTDTGMYKGYRGNEYKWDGNELNKIDSIKFKPDKTAIKLFESYIDKSKNDGIKIIFVYAPVYYRARDKIINISEMYKTYASIAQKYQIPILDYNFDILCKDSVYFYNAMHLNKKGSEKFSKQLANDLKCYIKN